MQPPYLRAEEIATFKHAFMDVESYRVDTACDSMRLTLDLHKATGPIVV